MNTDRTTACVVPPLAVSYTVFEAAVYGATARQATSAQSLVLQGPVLLVRLLLPEGAVQDRVAPDQKCEALLPERESTDTVRARYKGTC